MLTACLEVEDQLLIVSSYLEVRPSLGALQCASRDFRGLVGTERVWQRLCARDYPGSESDRTAPAASEQPPLRFDEMRECASWLETWRAWAALSAHVGGGVLPNHFRRAVIAWRRIRASLREQRLLRIDASLERSAGAGADAPVFAAMERFLRFGAVTTAATTVAEAEEAAVAEEAAGRRVLRVPSSLKALLAVHAGQAFDNDDSGVRCAAADAADAADDAAVEAAGGGSTRSPDVKSARRFFSGVLGGYSVYDDTSTIHLLPPRDALELNMALATQTPQWARERIAGMLLVGASLNHQRFVLLDLNDQKQQQQQRGAAGGGGCAGEEEGEEEEGEDGEEGRVVVMSRSFECGTLGRGGVLRLLETHAANLESGVLRAGSLIPDGPDAPISRGISLFPAAGRLSSDVTTRGVRIRASALCLNRESDAGLNWAYSVRITLLSAEEIAAAAAAVAAADGEQAAAVAVVPLGQCQLQSRHWEFVDADGVTRVVDGEAVVGKQPLLRAGGGYVDLGVPGAHVSGDFVAGDFVYQSQSGRVGGTDRPRVPADAARVGRACARGTFRFVPGTLREPTGPPFDAVIAEFPFALPEFGL
jgi:hypothetical protein